VRLRVLKPIVVIKRFLDGAVSVGA